MGVDTTMERVSIRAASHRLRLPTSSIRRCIQNGELKAYRQTGSDGRNSWVVELPEEGWTSAAVTLEMGRTFSPWWWADNDMTGNVHYVEALSPGAWEEILPKFLCGVISGLGTRVVGAG